MIKSIQGINGVNVSGGHSVIPYVAQNTANPMQGMIRIWSNDLQVFDNNNWITIQLDYPTIELAPEVRELLAWAKKKRDEELELERLSNTSPAVKIAVENLKNAQEQLEITKILSKE